MDDQAEPPDDQPQPNGDLAVLNQLTRKRIRKHFMGWFEKKLDNLRDSAQAEIDTILKSTFEAAGADGLDNTQDSDSDSEDILQEDDELPRDEEDEEDEEDDEDDDDEDDEDDEDDGLPPLKKTKFVDSEAVLGGLDSSEDEKSLSDDGSSDKEEKEEEEEEEEGEEELDVDFHGRP